jgi:ketosteroid isomerase-like protein
MADMAVSNVELARRGFEAIARGDFDAVAGMLDPNVRWHGGDPEDENACKNRKQALAWMQRAPRRGTGPLPALVDVVEGGDRVVVVMQPAPSADDPAPCKTANLATFRDGLVVEMVHYDDASDALAVLGRDPS